MMQPPDRPRTPWPCSRRTSTGSSATSAWLDLDPRMRLLGQSQPYECGRSGRAGEFLSCRRERAPVSQVPLAPGAQRGLPEPYRALREHRLVRH